MNLAPLTLSHGERYGALTVLSRSEASGKYLCGCKCGRREHFMARALMRADGVRSCRQCARALKTADL